jgi:hypothetical protein
MFLCSVMWNILLRSLLTEGSGTLGCMFASFFFEENTLLVKRPTSYPGLYM